MSEVNAYKDEFLFRLNEVKNPLEKIIYKMLGAFEPLEIMRKKLKIVTKTLEDVLGSRHSF